MTSADTNRRVKCLNWLFFTTVSTDLMEAEESGGRRNGPARICARTSMMVIAAITTIDRHIVPQ